MPCQYLVKNRQCKIPTKNNFCHIHDKTSKLMKKVLDQKTELTLINKRMSEAMRKLYIIDECDRIKYELMPMSKKCSFRTTITNIDNKDAIERIFKAPFAQCLSIYDDLLEKRNTLTHRYTRQFWMNDKKKPRHNRTLQELVSSIELKVL